MQRVGHLRVEGDMMAYGRNLLFLEQLFAALRPPPAPEPLATIGVPVIEPVIGRYLRLDFNGRPHRIYFEEAGQGIPLLCLHTAGADGRQYRALLNDPEITRRFRVVAFDLPWHGKSSPPPGFESEAYRLTTDLYVDTVMAVSRALSTGSAGRDGLFDRWPRRIASGAASWRSLPRGDRPAVGDARRSWRRQPPARSRRAVPSRRAWPGGGGRHGRLPDLADVSRRPRSGRPCGITCRADPLSSWATCTTISATATFAMRRSPRSTPRNARSIC